LGLKQRPIQNQEHAAPANRKLVTAAACTWLYDKPGHLMIDALLRQYDQPRL
jgi:hypothetical protein